MNTIGPLPSPGATSKLVPVQMYPIRCIISLVFPPSPSHVHAAHEPFASFTVYPLLFPHVHRISIPPPGAPIQCAGSFVASLLVLSCPVGTLLLAVILLLLSHLAGPRRRPRPPTGQPSRRRLSFHTLPNATACRPGARGGACFAPGLHSRAVDASLGMPKAGREWLGGCGRGLCVVCVLRWLRAHMFITDVGCQVWQSLILVLCLPLAPDLSRAPPTVPPVSLEGALAHSGIEPTATTLCSEKCCREVRAAVCNSCGSGGYLGPLLAR